MVSPYHTRTFVLACAAGIIVGGVLVYFRAAQRLSASDGALTGFESPRPDAGPHRNTGEGRPTSTHPGARLIESLDEASGSGPDLEALLGRVDILLENLASINFLEKQLAVEELEDLARRDPVVRAELQGRLADWWAMGDTRVSVEVAVVLGRLNDEVILSSLLEMLGQLPNLSRWQEVYGNLASRIQTIRSIRGYDSATDWVAEQSGAPTEMGRLYFLERLIYALAQERTPTDPMENEFVHRTLPINLAAARSPIREPEVLDALDQIARGVSDSRFRTAAIKVLSMSQNEYPAVRDLIGQLVTDSDKTVRIEAIESLAYSQDPRAIDLAKTAFLSEESPHSRQLILDAIKRFYPARRRGMGPEDEERLVQVISECIQSEPLETERKKMVLTLNLPLRINQEIQKRLLLTELDPEIVELLKQSRGWPE